MSDHTGDMTSAPPSAGEPRTLYTGFEGYLTVSESEYSTAIKTGMVVLDANVLLNLYRYDKDTRRSFLKLLRTIGQQLWIPHQALVEFWRNREGILRNPRDTESTIEQLEESKKRALSTLRGWFNRTSNEATASKEIEAKLISGYDNAIEIIRRQAVDEDGINALNTDTDPILSELHDICLGRVGDPLSEEDLRKALVEADRRIEKQIPPGYKDKKKGDDKAAGDYLVWLQLLLRAEVEKPTHILFVTNDIKEDWWRREQGELRGPRLELISEVRDLCGARLLFTRPAGLINHAGLAFDLALTAEAARDLTRVDQQAAQEVVNRELEAAEETANRHYFNELEHGRRDVLEIVEVLGFEYDGEVKSPGYPGRLLFCSDKTNKQFLVDFRMGRNKIHDVDVVTQFERLMLQYKVKRGVIISTGAFNANARSFASSVGNIQLIGGRELMMRMRQDLLSWSTLPNEQTLDRLENDD